MGRIDRRESKRITYICEVECETDGAHRITTRVNDISMTGMFIDSMTSFAVGRVLKLKFRVKDRLIEAMGEVRYSMPQVGMGVRFINLNAEQRAVLESLIEGKPLALPDPVAPQETIKTAASTDSNVFSGNFAVVSLFDVIQMIENSHLTGALEVTLPEASGEIYFNSGQIVDAKSGDDASLDALNKFLGATEGKFQFEKSDQPYEPTIQSTSNMALLLDLLRAKDEEEAGLAVLDQF
ncbi:MAG TPA: DUF4388 domain-containing protein [Blastocatellia bacterium]|nr:DUF4388 domain-containing protein [Blastocatellia bacterium]